MKIILYKVEFIVYMREAFSGPSGPVQISDIIIVIVIIVTIYITVS